MKENNGSKANSTGNNLEQTVVDLLKRSGKGYDVRIMTYNDYEKYRKFNKTDIYSSDFDKMVFIVKNWPYVSVYSSGDKTRRGRTEIVFIKGKEKPIRIECKWQQADGSVHEKYPYTIMSLYNCPEDRCILIYAGDAIVDDAIGWLKNESQCQHLNIDSQGNRRDKKEIKIYSLNEFMKWVNDGMIW